MAERREGFYIELLDLLKQDPENRFYSEDGKDLLRNKLYECAMKMDKDLIKLLLSNERIKNKFFTDVDGLLVFDKTAFGWAINNKAFLNDSYTRFKNTIGLIDSNEQFISSKNDVVLSFPYKDCVLEGGQTKEDQKRDEIYYNELLAPDDVDRLLAPKVFTNAKRYTKDGEEVVTSFNDDDNLLIKGNNLLALSSILKRYEGKVKCIYIDPPYNTGKKNSFGYNDNFNHSTWLTFMKNRLSVARKLLSNDGVLIVQCNDKEQAYLKVLCDEIFGKEQFETSFFVQVRFTNKTLAEDSSLHKVVETIHVYSKCHQNFSINKIKQEYSIDKFCWKIVEKTNPTTIYVGGKTVDIFKDGEYSIEKISPDFNGLKETWATGSLIRQGGTAAEFLAKYLIDRKKEDGLKVLYKVHNMGEDGLGYRYILGPQKASAFRGKFYSGIPITIKQDVIDGNYSKEMPVPNLLYNYLNFECEFGNCRTEGNVDIEGGKKPEQLLKYLLEYFSDENDLILDFFLGSGSTIATATKLKRKWIGIEQLDYGDNDSLIRLKNVINGDLTGISNEPDVKWQGGGSFVYCELKELNQKYIDKIMIADDDKLIELYLQITESEFISYKADINKLKEGIEDFKRLETDEKRCFLIEILDKNLLYVNYSDIEDEDFCVSEEDKAFTKSFYGEV